MLPDSSSTCVGQERKEGINMKAVEFCYWLQGYFELTNNDGDGLPIELNIEQVGMIQRHLALVFKHDIDPNQGPADLQAELQKIHDGIPIEVASVDSKSPPIICRC